MLARKFKNNISNCLISMPNNLNFELKDQTLTLKKGSKIYIPNGVENGVKKFDEFITTKDLSVQDTNTASYTTPTRVIRLVFYNVTNGALYVESATKSYTTVADPAVTWSTWYDMSTNIIRRHRDDATAFGYQASLPLAWVTSVGGGMEDFNGIARIGAVFNGVGFMGGLLFGLPGLKGLIPNGLNEDGSYNNIETELTSISLSTAGDRTWTRPKQPMFIGENLVQVTGVANDLYAFGPDITAHNKAYAGFYDTNNNKMYVSGATAGAYSQKQIGFMGYVYQYQGNYVEMDLKPLQSLNEFRHYVLRNEGQDYTFKRGKQFY